MLLSHNTMEYLTDKNRALFKNSETGIGITEMIVFFFFMTMGFRTLPISMKIPPGIDLFSLFGYG